MGPSRIFLSRAVVIIMMTPALRLPAQQPPQPQSRSLAPELSHQERFATPQGKLQLAEKQANEKLQKDPKDAKALVDRGLARFRMGRPQEALDDLQHATVLDPALADAYSALAYIYMLQEKWSESLEESRAALKLDPKHAGANYYVGHVLLQTGGDVAEAIRHLETAAERTPEDVEVQLELFMAYRQAHDPVRSSMQLRVLKVALPPNHPSFFYAVGLLDTDLGNLDSAIGNFKKALAANPKLDLVRTDLGVALVQSSRWQEAAEVLQPLAESQPQSFAAAYFHALALQNSGHNEQAETEAQRALSISPGSADAETLLGIIFSTRNDYKRATQSLSRAVQLDPNNFDAQFYLGRACYAINELGRARAAFEAASTLRPQDREVRFFLATVFENLGEKDAALAEYRQLTQDGPNDFRGFMGLGVMLAKYGQTQEALDSLRHALELDPQNYEANLATGRVLVQAGNVQDGLPLLKVAVEKAPDSPEAHYQLGLALRRAGRKADAEREFATVQRLNQEHRKAGMGEADAKSQDN